MHGARGGAPKGKKNGNFRHGGRTKEATSASRYINELLVDGQRSDCCECSTQRRNAYSRWPLRWLSGGSGFVL